MGRSLLLGAATFTTEARVHAPPEAVLAVLDDPPSFMRLNPLVVAVDPVPGEAGAYVVTDVLRMLGVSFRFRYKVCWQRVADGSDSEVLTAPATHLRNTLRVRADGPGSIVTETVRLRAPRPLVGYTRATAQASHREMLDGLRRRAEGGGPGA
jgi:hypothetical protein